MKNSRSNNNGRFFEYLITKYLHEIYQLLLSEQTLKDQLRDSLKSDQIKDVTKKAMENSLPTIAAWIKTKINFEKKTYLDRLPDQNKTENRNDHSDIKIFNEVKQIGISVKYNHKAVFHGRPYNLPIKCGFKKDSLESIQFQNIQMNRTNELKEIIPPGTIFSDNGVKEEYQAVWAEFMKDIVSNCSNFLNEHGRNKNTVRFVYKTIVGASFNTPYEDRFRLILDKNKLIIEDISNLTLPNTMTSSILQKGVIYQWFLCIRFDNGLLIECRHKHDSNEMSKFNTQVKIKPDWQIVDWGDSGMRRQVLEIKQ